MTTTDERRVRELLHSVEPPASRVDLRRAIATGRGQRRRRGYLAAGGIAVAVVLAAGAALSIAPAGSTGPNPAASVEPSARSDPASPGPTRDPASGCSEIRLVAPVRTEHLVPAGVDPAGRYVVGGHVDTEDREQFLWTDGVPARLPVTAGYGVADVNADGVVVGNYENSAWIYRNGTVTGLATPAGFSSAQVVAVNARGDAAGTAYRNGRSSVVVWWADKPDRPDVRLQPDYAEAADIADNGKVVGYAGALDTARPYRWTPGGVAHALLMPPGLRYSYAFYINAGWVVGKGAVQDRSSGGDSVVLLRWRLDTGTVEKITSMGTEPGERREPVAVGADGRMVVDLHNHVAIVPGPGGGSPRVFPHPPTLKQVSAAALTADGVLLAGVSTIDPTHSRPVLWRC